MKLLMFLIIFSFSSTAMAGNNDTDQDKDQNIKSLQGIVVWHIEMKSGVNKKDIDSLSGFLASQVDKYSGMKVISEGDMRTIIKTEEEMQKYGARDTA